MTVEPLNWIAWREARGRMTEIWDGWRCQLSHADRAMVDSLRRGNAPSRTDPNNPRAGAYEDNGLAWWLGKKIPLRDVVVGLVRLDFGSPMRAEYETEGFSHFPEMGPVKGKRTAVLVGAELAWDEFYDDLVRYELPRGAHPTPPRRPKSRRAAKQARHPAPPKPAPRALIHQEITAVYDQAEKADEKPPNVNQVIKPVQARLIDTGHHASGREIRHWAGDPRHAVRRWAPGETRKSKNRQTAS